MLGNDFSGIDLLGCMADKMCMHTHHGWRGLGCSSHQIYLSVTNEKRLNSFLFLRKHIHVTFLCFGALMCVLCGALFISSFHYYFEVRSLQESSS